MCGIAGVIGNFAPEDTQFALHSMVRSLNHRGPDDAGCFQWSCGENIVAFGHTRLSILDLTSAGHQPMSDRSGNYTITFNGEIYNFRELRNILATPSLTFQTGTDTEVILHAYHRWQLDAFKAMRGMFAFALLDRRNRKVLLVRDTLGIKPLYYCAQNGKIAFASEVRVLLACRVASPRINPAETAGYLRYGSVGKVDTLISGVKLLPPGHVLTIHLGTSEISFTESSFASEEQNFPVPSQPDKGESTAHLLHLLEESVKAHLVSDVPVGLFLSGGIDSNVLLHLMRKVGSGQPRTFTVVFPDRDLDESGIARRMADMHDAVHHEIPLPESELFRKLPLALTSMDQPTMDGVNTFVISDAVRSAGIKVALAGVGSDELFAGYDSFRSAYLAARAAKVPRSLRATFAGAAKYASPWRHQKFWDLLASDCSPSAVCRISRRLFAEEQVQSLVVGPCATEQSSLPQAWSDPVNAMSHLELNGYMRDVLLRDIDFMSMASALEVRVPFVDIVIVRYVLGLPGSWKLSRSKPKALLLDAMRGDLPGYVWNRPKMGFVLPFDRWMRTSLRDQMEATFSDNSLAQAVGISPIAAKNVWQQFLRGSLSWTRPWSLFVLLNWCRSQQVTI